MRAIELHLLLLLTTLMSSSEGEACQSATLTLKNQNKSVKIGENVTLVCSIDHSFTRLTYHWQKYSQSEWRKSSENTITIPFVTHSDAGQYQCGAYTIDPSPVPYSCASNIFTLHIQGYLTATLTLKDPNKHVYIGEDVTLDCRIEGGHTGWTYQWYKDNQLGWTKSTENTMTISSVTVSDSGQYQCSAYRDDLPTPGPVSSISNVVTLRIQDYPKAKLVTKIQKNVVYIGDTVSLECNIEGSFTVKKYRFYKGRSNQIKELTGNLYMVQSVTKLDNGGYFCEADINEYPHISQRSNEVKLTVHERKATLQIVSHHKDKQMSKGDEVQMSCNVNGDPVGWKYELYRNGNEDLYKVEMKKTFTISSVTPSDSGEYKCRAVKDELHSRFSETVQLQVSVETTVTTVTTVTTSKSNSGLDTSAIIIIVSLVPALLIFLLGLLLWVYHKKKGLPCLVSKKSRINVNSKEEITVQKEQEDASHHYQSIVEMDPVKKAGQDEVTYSELVHLPQKKKHGTSPVSSSDAGVYSEVRVSDRTRLTN